MPMRSRAGRRRPMVKANMFRGEVIPLRVVLEKPAEAAKPAATVDPKHWNLTRENTNRTRSRSTRCRSDRARRVQAGEPTTCLTSAM
jgi:hypothetical protein